MIIACSFLLQGSRKKICAQVNYICGKDPSLIAIGIVQDNVRKGAKAQRETKKKICCGFAPWREFFRIIVVKILVLHHSQSVRSLLFPSNAPGGPVTSMVHATTHHHHN
jgi:hypothetical protein